MFPFGCGHNVTPKPCHQMWFSACPHHAAELITQALTTAVDDDVTPFYETLQHLVADRLLTPAYYTWLAMSGRYAGPGADMTTPGAADIPPYLAHIPALVETACRAAQARDHANMDAALSVIADGGDLRATLSFMTSLAATAAITATLDDACTPDHITAFLLLGSQVSSGWGAAVLPDLVDMVMAQHYVSAGKASDDGVVQAFRRIIDIDVEDPHPLPVATDLVTRLLAQTLDDDVIVVDASEMQLIDIDGATPENTSREMLASAWTVRASRAYARAAGPDEASKGLQEVARSRGDAFKFAADVVTAGTQMIAYNHIGSVDTAGSPG